MLKFKLFKLFNLIIYTNIIIFKSLKFKDLQT